jgi:hypothetical protein
MCGLWYKQLHLVAAIAQDRQVQKFAVIQYENEHNGCHKYSLIIVWTVLQTGQGWIIFLKFVSGK